MHGVHSKIGRIHNYLTGINKFVLVLITIVLLFFSSIAVSLISDAFFGKSLMEDFPDFKSNREKIVIAVLLAPFLETLILQAAIIETAKKRMRPLYACFVSALFFGLVHFYNIFYFLYGLLAGLLLAYLYYIGTLSKRGFILTLAAHILYNFIVFIISIL
jgi:membrane protease YdiL (CAAX protease family)